MTLNIVMEGNNIIKIVINKFVIVHHALYLLFLKRKYGNYGVKVLSVKTGISIVTILLQFLSVVDDDKESKGYHTRLISRL